MISSYEIGDTVLLKGTIVSIEAIDDETILYKLREYNVPVREDYIVARIENPWELRKTDSN